MRQLTDHIASGDQAVQLKIEVADEPGSGGANHRYEITGADFGRNPSGTEFIGHEIKEVIIFQNGPIKESGVNGITDQSLAAILIDRQRGFQAGAYACADNAEALAHLEAYMECAHRRTVARIKRGVEGTNQK